MPESVLVTPAPTKTSGKIAHAVKRAATDSARGLREAWLTGGAGGVIAISALLTKPRSNQDVSTESMQTQPIELSNNEINTTHPPIVAADTKADEAWTVPVDPAGPLSIAGSVLNQQGERLADIDIIASPHRVFTS